jgi:LuxR family maltose regulon positive regulatory protein
LQLAQGDLAAAADWTQERGLSEDDGPGYSRETEYLVLARLMLAQDRPTQALALLERLHGAAITQGRIGSLIEIRALQALAIAACGDDTAAVDAVAEALRLGHPQGYVRVFVDEGGSMRALLGRLIAAQRSEQVPARAVPLDYLAQLLRAFDGQPGEPVPGTAAAAAAVAGLVEQLTAREHEVLALLAAGMSNARIAGELVITVDTVKKHVGHILDKLGAANRTEAVTRGQQLGLIS